MSETVYLVGGESKELLVTAMRGASTAPMTKEAARDRAGKVRARKTAKKQNKSSKGRSR